MSDIKTVVRVKHPDIVLTQTVAHDRSSKVKSVSEAGTDPTAGITSQSMQSVTEKN